MKLSDFDYTLPKGLIAQYPLRQRDESRMLVLDKENGKIEHCHFYDLADYLSKPDAMVFNDTKVFKARLTGKRTGYTGKIELLLLREGNSGVFECLAKPARKLVIGTELEFGNGGLTASVVDRKDEMCFVKFSNNNLYSVFNKIGLLPLPPYIKRKPQPEDEIRYQTVYAKRLGAVAAPTAGLHFTTSVIDRIKNKGAGIIYLTLHVGYDTFRPVKVDNIKQHKMNKEYFQITKKSVDEINKTKQNKGRVLAVGTTTCRALESASILRDTRYEIRDTKAETDLFIYPGYRFKIIDMLLTNFHLPKTTLLMLTCAFGGHDNVMKAYQEAVEKKYRFYSYGDCMLIK
ncbi:MAG: tRNA preQ1(34) S-adenosylmethionine ribosyltransferase-isomerase QueA [Candidatus Omnitrophota bacterium]|nr:MAG: tRNA preQ1(34) S-adenosylmethionine ribosyltransferase-isomerase QueA [Candidatus Omnitrophota bacterium]